MYKGHKHFGISPEIIIAEKVFWINFLFRNLDKVVTVIANIPNELICIVCGVESLNYSSRASLANHIKNHSRSTCNFWLDNIICKSPEELEAIILEGNVKGVFDI